MKHRRIHNYLWRCRKERGLTQREVAYILGLESSSMISRWEKGLAFPEIVNALKIAVIYCTTVDYVYQDIRLDMKDELSERMNAVLKTKVGYYE